MEIQKVGFVYTVERLGPDGEVLSVQRIHNIMPTVALNYMLPSALTGGAQYSAWYLGLFGNNYQPIATDTMTTLIASCGEVKSYTGTARQTITFPAVANATLTTLVDPNVFEFAAGVTVRGAFISSAPTWDGTTGVLCSGVLFPSPETINSNGGALRVPVGFTLVG